MTTLPFDQAVSRFKENEERIDTFLNQDGTYSTNEATPRQVETLPSLMQRLKERYLSLLDRGNWATTTVYAINDLAKNGGTIYLCTEPHTAGTFATDLAANKWSVYQGITPDVLAASSGASLIGKQGGGNLQDFVNLLPIINNGTSGNFILGSNNSGSNLNNNAAGSHNGDANTAFGRNVMPSATSSYACASFGYGAGYAMTTGHSNSLYGYQAGHLMTTGTENTLVGVDAAYQSTAINKSVVIGHHCLSSANYSGEGLIVIGQQTARSLSEGNEHIVIGRNAQSISPATGSNQSVIVGSNSALASAVSGSVIVGKDIMQSSGAGTRNATNSAIVGYRAMFGTRSSANDCVLGSFALFQNDGSTVDSNRNAAFGNEAGYYANATNCTFFGYRSGAQNISTPLTGVVAIGYRAGDNAGGGTPLADNDFVLSNETSDARRLIWGNFATRVVNFGGVVNIAGRTNANGGLKIGGIAPPANSSATGETGEVRTDSGYVYVCVAPNTWKRAALSTW